MTFKSKFQMWKARKLGQPRGAPAVVPAATLALEFHTLELMTDRKKCVVDRLNNEVCTFMKQLRYKSERMPELGNQPMTTMLGQSFVRCGSELPADSQYGSSLVKAGDVLIQIGNDFNYIETQIRDYVMRPLGRLQDDELRRWEYERQRMFDRRQEFEVAAMKFEGNRGNYEAESKMLSAKSRYEESIRSCQDLMYRINFREQDEMDRLRFFMEGLRQYYELAFKKLDGAIPSLTDPSIRGPRIQRSLSSMMTPDLQLRIESPHHTAPYQMEIPPRDKTAFPLGGMSMNQRYRYDSSSERLPKPLGTVSMDERIHDFGASSSVGGQYGTGGQYGPRIDVRRWQGEAYTMPSSSSYSSSPSYQYQPQKQQQRAYSQQQQQQQQEPFQYSREISVVGPAATDRPYFYRPDDVHSEQPYARGSFQEQFEREKMKRENPELEEQRAQQMDQRAQQMDQRSHQTETTPLQEKSTLESTDATSGFITPTGPLSPSDTTHSWSHPSTQSSSPRSAKGDGPDSFVLL